MVEFAFIFPMLLMILIGTIEMSFTLMVERKVRNTSQAIADLVAQRKSFDLAALAEIEDAAALMFRPFAPEFTLSIAHVPFDSDTGNPDMALPSAWRAVLNGGRELPDAVAESAANGAYIANIDPPLPLGGNGDALVIVELTYRYLSPVGGFFLDRETTFIKVNYSRPRLQKQISGSAALIAY